MLKHVVIIIVLSFLAMLFLSEAHYLLNFLVFGYNKLNHSIQLFLPNNHVMQLISATASLILIPVLVGLVLNLIFWAITRRSFAHLWMAIWFVWLLLLALLH